VSDENDKPKRASLPPGLEPSDVTLPMAVELLALPKTLGVHPTTKKEIKAGLGRFGPFVVHDGDYRSIPKGESIFTMTLQRALEMLNQPKKGRGGRSTTPLRELGNHPETQEPVNIMNGPYGAYVKSGKINASLPEGVTPEQVTLEQAMQWLADKAGSSSKGKGKKKASSKAVKAAAKPLKDAKSAGAKAEVLGVKKVVTRKKK